MDICHAPNYIHFLKRHQLALNQSDRLMDAVGRCDAPRARQHAHPRVDAAPTVEVDLDFLTATRSIERRAGAPGRPTALISSKDLLTELGLIRFRAVRKAPHPGSAVGLAAATRALRTHEAQELEHSAPGWQTSLPARSSPCSAPTAYLP